MKKLFILLLILPMFSIAQERVYPTGISDDPNNKNSTSEDPTSGAGVAKEGFATICDKCKNSQNVRLIDGKPTNSGPNATGTGSKPGTVDGDGVE